MKLVLYNNDKWVIRVGFWPFYGYLDPRDGFRWNSLESAFSHASYPSESAARAAVQYMRNKEKGPAVVKVVKP